METPEVLPEFRVTLTRVPPGEEAYPAEASVEFLGRRTKLGGKPDWIQYEAVPTCPSCGEAMVFVAQIDSVEHSDPYNPHAVDPLSEDQCFMFADVGMIYVFICHECLETASVLQF